jgi:hypothetical protein
MATPSLRRSPDGAAVNVKIQAVVGNVRRTFEYGNVVSREDVGGRARLRIGLNEA